MQYEAQFLTLVVGGGEGGGGGGRGTGAWSGDSLFTILLNENLA